VKTSVVIPVHGKARLTRSCLEWLARDVDADPEVEVIVVDDGSPDDTRRVVEEAGWVRLVSHEQPAGFAAACNDGAAAASGDYVLFLNNDTEGRPRWLERLVAYADAVPEAAAVGAKLLYRDNSVQHAGIVFAQDLMPRHVYRGFPADHPAVARSRPFQAVTAACLLVRRRVFDHIGGFDRDYANGFEDVDLCLRLGQAGHGVHLCVDSVLVHDEAATRGEDTAGFRRNADRYLERWRGTVRADELATYAEDGLLVLEPGDAYPLRLHVAPELAVPETDVLDAFALLRLRAAQVLDLLKENTALRNA
jgi:GT2 family glycosyltransferase